MKVRFNRAALADLAEILDYIETRNPKAAAELSQKFEEAAILLGEMPDMGSPTSREQFRKLVVGKYLVA